MADGGDGFDSRIEVVQRTRGYRRWPGDVKARLVAESFQPGARVAEVARKHDLAAHQLSDWRCQAREGLLVLPADAMSWMSKDNLPAFVPASVEPENTGPSADADRAAGVITIEIGGDFVLRVPGDVPAERAAAVARALRGPA
ncbi:transposase [Roseovarius sp. MBR-51]